MITRQMFFLLLIILQAIPFEGSAQQKDNTVSKVVNKSIPWLPDDELSIVGEKADISVKGWEKSYVQMKLIFSAIHSDKNIAARELQYMQYSLSKEDKIIELRNAFHLPYEVDRLHSKLNVSIELMVPSQIRLMLDNKYGTVELTQLTKKVAVSVSFCDLILNNIQGEMSLHPSYSEVRGDGMRTSSFVCEGEKSQITLSLTGGSYDFSTSHGSIDLEIKRIRSLDIKSSRTGITVRTDFPDYYNYELVARLGKIYTPDAQAGNIKESEKQSSLDLKTAPQKPFIRIYTTYSPITIK